MSSKSIPDLDDEKRRALDLLASRRSFLLAGHVRPDGDCAGSQGALARVLASLGKEVVILNPDPPEPRFDAFVRHCPFRTYEGGEVPEHDVCVLLDINDLGRCGDMAGPLERAGSLKVVVDHHPHEGEPWWDASFVDVGASATGILVWRIARALGCELDEPAAIAIFTAIVTDTGWFRYSNTDAETLEVAAALLRRGIRPARTYSELYQRSPPGEPKALAALLQRLEYFAGGRLAVVDQPLEDAGVEPLGDSDTLLDVVRSVGDVEVVLFVKQLEDGLCKVSARSKSDYDVNALVRRFGGGGHVKAAGATIRGSLPDVRSRLVEAAVGGFGPPASAGTGGGG